MTQNTTEKEVSSEGRKNSTDGREPWEWKSRYPPEAQQEIRREAITLASALVGTLLLAAGFLALDGEFVRFSFVGVELWIGFRWFAIFFVGGVGGVTFSIKWLIHAVSKGKWHQDRRYWRYLVPLLGGVYACVVITLWDVGLVPMASSDAARVSGEKPTSMVTIAPLAFLLGYFSDGVSGLLSNVANAVFGTVRRK